MSKDIIVLAPNGHRQKVKCSLNTTILQILEEVCKKQGYDADQYDLTHHNKVLDLTNTIRFSNLPNKAGLEMVERELPRKDNIVTVGLQLESGERPIGDFSPKSVIYDVLTSLAQNEFIRCEHPTVIYTRREIHGMDELRRTTLKDLGLTGGRAVLRLLDKSPEELKTQANVSSVLPQRPAQFEKPNTSDNRSAVGLAPPPEPVPDPPPPPEPVPEPPPSPGPIPGPPPLMEPIPGPSHRWSSYENKDPVKLIKEEMRQTNNTKKKDPTKQGEETAKNVEDENMELDILPVLEHSTQSTQITDFNQFDEEFLERRLNIEQEVTFLGENKAIAFTQSSSEPELSSLPDEFYELTVDEVRRLHSELRRDAGAADPPLLTAEQRARQLTRETSKPSHKHVVVRVQFPDRVVLQGVFTPAHTIRDVHSFTRLYLRETHRPFLLYTTPTRESLEPGLSLAEARFVPGVLMHFRWADDGAAEPPFLQEHVYSNRVSSDAAAILASKYRTPVRQKREMEEEMSGRTAVAGTSSVKDGKLPKWFKLRS